MLETSLLEATFPAAAKHVQQSKRQMMREGRAEEWVCSWNPFGYTVSAVTMTRTNMPLGMVLNLNCSGISKCAVRSNINNITVSV